MDLNKSIQNNMPNVNDYNNIFREYRENKGYTQEQLAELIGISTRQLQRIEYNESETKIKTLRKLIDVLEISEIDILMYLKGQYK